MNLNIRKQLYNSVRQKFDEFYQNFLEMEMTYGDMCTMFRENNTEIDPPILFGYITQFVESFKVSECLNDLSFILFSSDFQYQFVSLYFCLFRTFVLKQDNCYFRFNDCHVLSLVNSYK